MKKLRMKSVQIKYGGRKCRRMVACHIIMQLNPKLNYLTEFGWVQFILEKEIRRERERETKNVANTKRKQKV